MFDQSKGQNQDNRGKSGKNKRRESELQPEARGELAGMYDRKKRREWTGN